MRQLHAQPTNGAIRVAVPADPVFLTGVRVMTRTAAALSDLSVDDIDEMQMAVDEAATLLLPLAVDRSQELTATFTVSPALLTAVLSIPCPPDAQVDRQGLGWMMLTGLDPDVRLHIGDGAATVSVSRSAAA